MTKIKNIPSVLFSFWVLLLTQASTLATNEEDIRVNNSCLPGEGPALLTLKAGFVDPKHRLSSWEGNDCCFWSGVTCSKATGHVVKLDLRNTEWDSFPDDSYALGGEIRSSLLSLRYLNYLDLSYNNFSYAQIPHFIGSLNKLKYLNLSFSNFGGRIPPQLSNLPNLQYLDLFWNEIEGNIPPQLGNLSNLQYLGLSWNEIEGNIPPQLGNLSNLQYLGLSWNEIEGNIPPQLGNLSNLQYLDLSWNFLNGSIPQFICQLKNLQLLDLSSNVLEGNFPNFRMNIRDPIPKNNSRLGSNNQSFIQQIVLRTLILSNNNLSGEFPRHLKYYINLQLLNIENNNFFGSIPPWIRKKLSSLRFLILGSNRFTGAIPDQLFKLETLQLLDISNNNLNGTIPSLSRTLMGMTSRKEPFDIYGPFDITIGSDTYSDIGLTVTVLYTKGQLLNFEHNILDFKSLDLSCNNLVGKIPEEIVGLDGLMNLNLSGNMLSGYIPRSIGNLRSLESLDFSNNELSGSIPSSLSALTFLNHLNLSYNNLSGRIPTGHQLQTLDDPSIYEENNGLCGFPLPIECSENKTTPLPFVSEKENGNEVYVGTIIGFAVGAWMVYGALLFNKSWRGSYFVFVDNMYDTLDVIVILNWIRITGK